MNILNKILYAAWFAWIVFFAAHLITSQSRIPTVDFFIAAGCIFIISGICYFAIHKPLMNLLNKVVDARITNNYSEPLPEMYDDEIAILTSEINALFAIIRDSQNKVSEYVEQRTEFLESENKRLQSKLSDQETVEKDLILHKEHLVRLAHYDGLTTLPNRVFFNQILNKAIAHAKRQEKTLAIVFIDLDKFKIINDTLGHSFGDTALKETALRFNSILRAGDVLARLGGDEFIVLINDLQHPKFIGPIAEKLLTACNRPLALNHQEFTLSASLGIAIFPNDGMSLEQLQQNADEAMYAAKKKGGNTYEFFTSKMNLQAQEHVTMDKELRDAVLRKEFILHYQPKYNLKDGLLAGVEALLRWESPVFGLVTPDKFLPLAEETGLINTIGEFVIQEACRVNQFWQMSGYKPIAISVNLSAKQFLNPNLIDIVTKALAGSIIRML